MNYYGHSEAFVVFLGGVVPVPGHIEFKPPPYCLLALPKQVVEQQVQRVDQKKHNFGLYDLPLDLRALAKCLHDRAQGLGERLLDEVGVYMFLGCRVYYFAHPFHYTTHYNIIIS